MVNETNKEEEKKNSIENFAKFSKEPFKNLLKTKKMANYSKFSEENKIDQNVDLKEDKNIDKKEEKKKPIVKKVKKKVFKKIVKEEEKHISKPKVIDKNKNYPTLGLKTEREIAMDFAQKAYIKFDKIIKSAVLFGSVAKHTNTIGSDIDIILIIDDASIRFDEEMIAWYREELGKIIQENPYKQELHINTIKLTTWWEDLSRGDPVVINIIRYGDVLIDFGGFFNPLKILLQEGRIKPTPESIYTCLNRVPYHIIRSKQAELSAIEGCYWAMVDSSQSLLMALNLSPPSPEHIPNMLRENFVDKKLMKERIVSDFSELWNLHEKIMHGEVRDLKGEVIDGWQYKAQEFFNTCTSLIKAIIDTKK